MSAEENRSVGNLLLLCIPHAYEVDDPNRLQLYPEQLLQFWKEQQLADYDGARGGWQLTDQEAAEVIRESYNAEIIIQGDTINLGGQGGQAFSAGGAGGSAIGRGAIGGKGGPGGPITMNLSGHPGAAPGAGGGGGGGIDPESELLWRGPGRTPTVGLYEYLGIDGQDGGDTTFSDAEGNVLLRARGGQGARAGTGNRSTSDKFSISTLLLANHIEITGAYASILTTGFAHYNAININDHIAFVGLMILEGGGVPEGEYAFSIQIHAPDGTVANTGTFAFRIIKPGDITRMILQFSMPTQIKDFGMWAIAVQHNRHQLALLSIAVQQGVSGATTALSE
jgi:hypothetical protein